MKRFLRYALVLFAGIAIALVALIWEGGTFEHIFSVPDVPEVDFASLQRAPTPNQYLLCPEGMCSTETDGHVRRYTRRASTVKRGPPL